MKDRKVKTSPSGGWYQRDKEGNKERVKESKCGRNTRYS
jgi:hypothetical protein